MVLGLGVLASDAELREAIEQELRRHLLGDTATIRPNLKATITALLAKHSKLFQLQCDDRITVDTFGYEGAGHTASN